MAESVRRRSWGGVLPLGRQASISGSSLIQCASVSIAPSSSQEGQNARHHKQFKLEQALVAMKRASPHFRSSVALGGKADIEQAVLRRSLYGYTGARETIVAAVTAAVLISSNYGTE